MDYLETEPIRETEALNIPETPTAVVTFTDYPLDKMTIAFDSTFQNLFPALAEAGLSPVGPALALHRRMPTDTCTFEVGVPVDKPLDKPIDVNSMLIEPSKVPAGRVARVSHVGSYEEMPTAWGDFMDAIAASGNQPALPFWEIYVSEPTPDMDPATLRTDLYTLLAQK